MNHPVKILLLFSFFTFPLSVAADEGMWLPMMLQETVYHDMKNNGLRLSPEEIYSANQSSLKDAVLLFGGGCTGEMISGEGLLLTNHHCGLGQIQSHSSVENDYVTNGFWAAARRDELPCPGLTVTFIVRMEDVTPRIQAALPAGMAEMQRAKIIDSLGQVISNEAMQSTHYAAVVRPFYSGNQFILIVSETYKDIRLVGAPPQSIGNFGGDEDNWMWPRHTGDFSLFRIYADQNNRPAEFSADNVPFKPRHFFPVSMKGVKEGDFTMVYGFPGRTTQYIPSWGVELVQDISDPEKIKIRDARLEVWWNRMMQNDTVRVKYSSKYYGVSNAWKKWQGEVRGLKKAGAVAKKQSGESEFTSRIHANARWKQDYGALLPSLKTAYDSLKRLQPVYDYYTEALQTPELWKPAGALKPLMDSLQKKDLSSESLNAALAKAIKQLGSFYKNYDAATDRQATAVLLELYGRHAGAELTPPELGEWIKKYGGNYPALTDELFSASVLDNKNELLALLENYKKGNEKKILSDPAYRIGLAVTDYFNAFILPPYQKWNERVALLNRDYVKAQMEVFPEKKFYPDANLSLRITHGQVKGYEPRDAVHYTYFTTLDGIMEKYKPQDEFYDAPARLVELHHQRDYGRYADADGTLHTCFIASNHTTGGNSGSPVLDANGYLIGINFDRCWEGTMSDLYYDPSQCRNIAADIRYILFVIDKVGGAGYLLNEMKVIN